MVLVAKVKEGPVELAAGWLMGDDSSPLPVSFNTCSYKN